MPVIQITTSVRAIAITEPLHLKAGEWLMIMEDDSYRKASKAEAASLDAGTANKPRRPGFYVPPLRTGLDDGLRLNGKDLLPRHIKAPAISRGSVTMVINGKSVTMASQMYRCLAALDRAAHLAKAAVTGAQISNHLEYKTDRPQVNARMIDLVARGFVEEVREMGTRMRYCPTNNGLAILMAEPAGRANEAAHA